MEEGRKLAVRTFINSEKTTFPTVKRCKTLPTVLRVISLPLK